MAVRLRYLAHDLEVPPGQFVVGRTADCQLSLDDPLVSRRHALLTVRGDAAVVEDLGSRNGVLVNGIKIAKPYVLVNGDVVTIGAQELTVSGLGAAGAPEGEIARSRTQERRMTLNEEDLGEDPQTTIAQSPMFPAPEQPDKRVHGLTLIGGVADKCLAMGRGEEAERLLSRTLSEIVGRARAGEELSRELAEATASYAIRLASGTGKGTWIELALELYSILGLVLPGRLVDDLYVVVRRVKHVEKSVLRAYVARLREQASTFGPAERFLQQRIEGLERWAP